VTDDLSADAIAGMKEIGFWPALIVETSTQNFQVWLNHGRVLDQERSTQVAKELARRFVGDPSSADWRHFGRLAGFTNQKPGRRLGDELPPFVRLREWSGRIYDQAEDFLTQVAALAAATCIAPTWRGRCTRRAADFQKHKSKPRYSMPETFQRRADQDGSSNMRSELPKKQSPPPVPSTLSAAS